MNLFTDLIQKIRITNMNQIRSTRLNVYLEHCAWTTAN